MKRCLTCNAELPDDAEEICNDCKVFVNTYRSDYKTYEITTLKRVNKEIESINGSFRNRPFLQIKDLLTKLYALKIIMEQSDENGSYEKAKSILEQINKKRTRNLTAKKDLKARLFAHATLPRFSR